MDKGGEYSLKWNSHKATVMSAFTCLFENEKHADCTLAAEGKIVKAHKVMIAACSPYLERLLEEHSKDKSSSPIVIFNDLSYFELKALCEYMYKGEVNVPKENLDSFLKVAKNLQVRGLCDGGGGDSIGGSMDSKNLMRVSASSPKRKTDSRQQMVAKRKRQDGFDSDTSGETVSYISSPSTRGRPKQMKTTAKIVATCPPRVVQEVKPVEVKQEEPETVYEETVYQDLTFEGEIYQDPNSEPGTSNNDTTIEFSTWNDGNSNDMDSGNQEQAEVPLYCCLLCNKQYFKLKSLQSHQRYECGKTPEYSCPHCPYRSKQRGYLNQHIRVKHTPNSQRYYCTKCDYSSKYKSNLNIHLRSVTHNPANAKRNLGSVDNKHLCQSCGRIYSSLSALKLHQRKGCPVVQVHNCAKCPFKTNIPASLNRHMLLKHTQNPIIYKCGHCDFMTKVSSILRSHLTKEHNEISPYEIDKKDDTRDDNQELDSVQNVEEVFTLDTAL